MMSFTPTWARVRRPKGDPEYKLTAGQRLIRYNKSLWIYHKFPRNIEFRLKCLKAAGEGA